jgi:hypothetical protein
MVSTVSNISLTTYLPQTAVDLSWQSRAREISLCVKRVFNTLDRWSDDLALALYRFLERYLILPIDLWWNGKSYFAQFHGDHYIHKATGYTGARFSIGFLHMIKNLENHLIKFPEDKEKIAPILDSLKASLTLTLLHCSSLSNSKHRGMHRLKRMAHELCCNVAKLSPNQFLAIPCSWREKESGHAFILMIKRNSKGILERYLINTGSGQELYHGKIEKADTQETKFEKTLGYQAEKDEDFCDPDFYQSILELRGWENENPSKILYEDIWATSKGKKIDSDPSNCTHWNKGQRSGTCVFKSIMQLVLLQFGDAKEADILYSCLLEEDLRKRFTWYKAKWTKNPNSSDRVLLENATYNLMRRKEKGKCKNLDLTLEKEIISYIQAEFKQDMESSKWRFPLSKEGREVVVTWSQQEFTWNKEKKYYECAIEGVTYRVSENQTITFLSGFRDFIVVENDHGERKALIFASDELEPLNLEDPLAPFIKAKEPLSKMMLLPLDSDGKLSPKTASVCFYFAALAFAMRRYEKVKFYLDSISIQKGDIKDFVNSSLIAKLVIARKDRDPTAIAIAMRAIEVCIRTIKERKKVSKEHNSSLENDSELDSFYKVFIDHLFKCRELFLDCGNNAKYVRCDLFPNFSDYLKQIDNEFGFRVVDIEKKNETEEDKPAADTEEKLWTVRYNQFKNSFPITERTLDKISLTRPESEFYLCFFHYYSALKTEGCLEAEREKIKRRLNYMRGDKDPLNQHLRNVLLDLCDHPGNYNPLANAKDPANFKEFFASLNYS